MRYVLPVLMVVLSVAASAQDKAVTKEDVTNLAKAGVSEDVILAKIQQDKATFTLTVDDIAALKAAGVTEKVLQFMIGRPAPSAPVAPAPSVPKVAGDATLVLRNVSHRDVKVTVDEKNFLVDIRMHTGADLTRGGTLEFKAAPGDYHIAIEGTPTRYAVRVAEKGAAIVTVKGADTSYIDLMTAIIEDSKGRAVMILHSQGKQVEPDPRGPVARSPSLDGFYGPQLSYLPIVSGNVLLGAGVGAVIGHHYDHTARGAWIGAGAGLLLDTWGWGWGYRHW